MFWQVHKKAIVPEAAGCWMLDARCVGCCSFSGVGCGGDRRTVAPEVGDEEGEATPRRKQSSGQALWPPSPKPRPLHVNLNYNAMLPNNAFQLFSTRIFVFSTLSSMLYNILKINRIPIKLHIFFKFQNLEVNSLTPSI